MLKVLVVSSKYPPEYSGSGLRAHRTYQRLAKKYGLQFQVVASSIVHNNSVAYEYEGVSVQRIAGKCLSQVSLQRWDSRTGMNKLALRINYVSEMLLTWRYLSQNHYQYDVVHVFGNNAVVSAAITFCNRIKKPLVVEVTYDEDPRPYQPLIMKRVGRSQGDYHPTTRIICISKKLESRCRELGLRNEIWTRPNPVDGKRFFPDFENRAVLRKKVSSFLPTDIVLVNVTKMMPLKNQSFLIDVLKQLPEQYKLVLAGPVECAGPNAKRDQAYRREINEKIKSYGLVGRVEVVEKFITNPDEYMKMANVYVFPSVIEGLGTPLLESICCGVPVVAHRIIGVTDRWIVDGKNGYLSPLDVQEFAAKIEQAVNIPEKTLDQSARELIQVAGTDVIDQKYYELLCAAVRKEDNVK